MPGGNLVCNRSILFLVRRAEGKGNGGDQEQVRSGSFGPYGIAKQGERATTSGRKTLCSRTPYLKMEKRNANQPKNIHSAGAFPDAAEK